MKSSRHGFTLIELLIVIAILGVLAAVLVTVLNPSQQFKKARDAQRRSDLAEIRKALEIYYTDNGKYPETVGVTAWVNSTAGGFWIPGLGSTYIKSMPKDPINNGCTSANNDPRESTCYTYSYYSSTWCSIQGRDYILVAHLEAYPGSDLSQKRVYNADGTFCSNWMELPQNSYMTLLAP